jgi:integrase
MGSVEPYDTAAGKRYRVQYRTPDRRNTMKRGFTTKRSAELFLASVEVSKVKGEWVDPTKSRALVSLVAEEWFRAQIQVKPTTRSGYRFHLDKYVLPRWGTTRLVDIRHGDIQAWVGELSEILGPSMVRQIHLVLAGVLRYAIRDGRLVNNPSDEIQLPRLGTREHGYLTHGQVRALVEECGPQGDVVLFLAYTGLRWGEMAGLRINRVDFERRRIDVARAVSEPRGVIVWGTPKNHERRSVPFPDLLAPSLEQRCAGRNPEDPVFIGPDGGVLRAGNYRNRVFNAAVARCMEKDDTFPRLTLHDLRHTAASLAVSAGANVKSVQRMLGHASAAMTLDVYADLFDDDLDAVAIALNDGAANSVVVKM